LAPTVLNTRAHHQQPRCIPNPVHMLTARLSCLPPAAVSGELAITVPALGTSQQLLNANHHAVYFEGMPPLEAAAGPGTSRAVGSSASAGSSGGSIHSTGSDGSDGSDGSMHPGSAAPRWFLRRHGDAFERLPGGSYRALGRLDDTMNLGGIKVGAGEAGQRQNGALVPAELPAHAALAYQRCRAATSQFSCCLINNAD